MGLTLDVAVVTHGKEGIKRVEKMLLPPQDGVRYVVSWQEHENAPIPFSIGGRNDVEVFRLDVKGLSNNRNNSISHCQADIVLVADDDLIYEPDAFNKIRSSFERNPSLDFATFRVNFNNEKHYPPNNTRLTVPFPKNYWVSSVEIAFRRNKLNDICFNPMVGLGAPVLIGGEDELYAIDAIRAGKNCLHIAEYICSHPHPSTGDRVNDGILKSNGFLIRTIYPYSYLPRIILKAYRLKKAKKCGMLNAIRNMLIGALSIKRKYKNC